MTLIRLNRPEALNALNSELLGELGQALDVASADAGVRCVVLTGAGRAFSAGGDVKAMKSRAGAFAGNGIDLRDGYRNNIHRIVRSIYGLEVPSIAAVNGDADLQVASVSPAGFDEALYPRLARVAGVAGASPVVQLTAAIPGDSQGLTLIGLDIFRAGAVTPGKSTLPRIVLVPPACSRCSPKS